MRKMTIMTEPLANESAGEVTPYIMAELDIRDRSLARPVALCDTLAEASRWMKKRNSQNTALLFQADTLVATIQADGRVTNITGDVYYNPEGMANTYGVELAEFPHEPAADRLPFPNGGTFTVIGRLESGTFAFENIPVVYGSLISTNIPYSLIDGSLLIDQSKSFLKMTMGKEKSDLKSFMHGFCVEWMLKPENKLFLVNEELKYEKARTQLCHERVLESKFQVARISADMDSEMDKLFTLNAEAKRLEKMIGSSQPPKPKAMPPSM